MATWAYVTQHSLERRSVAGKVAILIDDLADTSNTITRAAKLLRKEGAHKIYALVTHGSLSGEAIDRINASVYSNSFHLWCSEKTTKSPTCTKLKAFARLCSAPVHGHFIYNGQHTHGNAPTQRAKSWSGLLARPAVMSMSGSPEPWRTLFIPKWLLHAGRKLLQCERSWAIQSTCRFSQSRRHSPP